MKTILFKSKEEFIRKVQRGDLEVNGVTQAFLDKHQITLKEMNKQNEENENFFCFNVIECFDCEDCFNCEKCHDCVSCYDCIDCIFCVSATKEFEKTGVLNY